MWGFLRGVLFICFMFGEVSFKSFCKFPPCEHDTPPTAFAFKPDICTETRDCPFIGTTRMLFAQSQMVVEAEVREHRWVIGYLHRPVSGCKCEVRIIIN